jgi:hypothetical protein
VFDSWNNGLVISPGFVPLGHANFHQHRFPLYANWTCYQLSIPRRGTQHVPKSWIRHPNTIAERQ